MEYGVSLIFASYLKSSQFFKSTESIWTLELFVTLVLRKQTSSFGEIKWVQAKFYLFLFTFLVRDVLLSCSSGRPAQRGEFCSESMFQLHLHCSHIRKRCLSFFWQDEQGESLQQLNGFKVHLASLIIASRETWRLVNYCSNIDMQEALWFFNVCKHLALPHCVCAHFIVKHLPNWLLKRYNSNVVLPSLAHVESFDAVRRTVYSIALPVCMTLNTNKQKTP